MERLKSYVLAVALGLAGPLLHAQDPEFTQFFVLPTWTNPALAGAFNLPGNPAPAPRITMAHRNRWPQFSGSYTTSMVTMDARSRVLHGGLGLRVLQDNAGRGTIGSRELAFDYNYLGRISRKVHLNLALEISYYEKSLAWDLLTFEDMVDSEFGFIYNTQETPRGEINRGVDFAAGGVVHTSSASVGLAVHHLNEPNQTLLNSFQNARLPMRWTVHAEKQFSIGSSSQSTSAVGPKMRYVQQGEFQLFEIGTLWIETLRSNSSDKNLDQFVHVGLFYRGFPEAWRHDAISLNLGLETVSYRVNYAWDLTFSSLSPATGGAHELILTWYLPSEARQKRFCPVCDWKILNTGTWQNRRATGRFQ